MGQGAQGGTKLMNRAERWLVGGAVGRMGQRCWDRRELVFGVEGQQEERRGKRTEQGKD